ncbi:MAG TPA: UDPGP type 1 family protein [Gemmataceae bacterium]|jgi:UDP-N-acetylglucosamine/UDP-N-acetylgalactosamine diphosphorylase|nr:UDPGP type 1 family protein [Gemmataceae bacterium]
MHDVPPELMHRLRHHSQEHVLLSWERLNAQERSALVNQLAGIDLDEIAELYAKRTQSAEAPTAERLKPIPTESSATIDADTVRLGHEALARGELAVLLVAGGQGTRLGFDKPKGMFPIGPVSNKTLFQIHADKVFALARRYGKPVPFLVMTSTATHADTTAYFAEQNYFDLGRDNVYFFQQGTMPAVDIATGRLLLEAPGVLFTSPNGHGGTLTALSESGVLDAVAARGVKHVFYFQVDNPLVKIGDPAFLGKHIVRQAEASSKAIAKVHAREKMGVLALVDGRCGIVEYSDLPDELAHLSDKDGQLIYRAGSPAIHLFDLAFLRRITQGATRLPFHIAKKKVPHIDDAGKPVTPAKENALKFEMFVFDALPMAERWLVMESPREDEFAPVKNADGADSPTTAKQAISNQAGRWLAAAGVKVRRDTRGNVGVPLEVSPRFALDVDQFKTRVDPGRTINGPTYFE